MQLIIHPAKHALQESIVLEGQRLIVKLVIIVQEEHLLKLNLLPLLDIILDQGLIKN